VTAVTRYGAHCSVCQITEMDSIFGPDNAATLNKLSLAAQLREPSASESDVDNAWIASPPGRQAQAVSA